MNEKISISNNSLNNIKLLNTDISNISQNDENISDDEFENHDFDNNTDIIGELVNIVISFNNPDTIIQYLYNYSYFHSNIIAEWIGDYYLFQSNVITNKFHQPNKKKLIILDLPLKKGIFMWINKYIDCHLHYNWIDEHSGYIDFNYNYKLIFDSLRLIYDNYKDLFYTIIPTKYDLTFSDNYRIKITKIKDKECFSMREFKKYFINVGNNKYNSPTDYLKKCDLYIGVNEIATELNHISECIYGYIIYLLRSGIEIEKEDYIENENFEKELIENSDTIIFIDEDNHFLKNFNIYESEKYYIKCNEKRKLIFKEYYILSEKYQNMPNKSKKVISFLSGYEDLKKLVLMLYFKDFEDSKLISFTKKYSDKNGFFSIFDSIGEVIHCCDKFIKNEDYIKDCNNMDFDISNELINNLFVITLNNENNNYMKKYKSNLQKKNS
jgi:hypothetical protein